MNAIQKAYRMDLTWTLLCCVFLILFQCSWTLKTLQLDQPYILQGRVESVWSFPTYQKQEHKVYIDAGRTTANFTHFWRSTGFCPPEPHNESYKWFLSQDMQHNLAYIGAIPQKAVQQVRIHWLLDAVMVEKVVNGRPFYNYSYLDELMDNLWNNGLKPGFEVMGNPSGFFSNFSNKTQVYLWRDFIYQLATHYISRYLTAYVLTWNFEVWNEPNDLDFDGLIKSLPEFLNYYDATSEGLKAANPALRLGGPGGSCHDFNMKSYCWALLDHTQNGINFVTEEKGVRIDYLSFHKKGDGPDNTNVIIEKEEDTISQLHKHMPSLVTKAIFNDEGDPLEGWNKDLWWRADVTYAAMVAKVIVQHQQVWLKPGLDVNFELLSNDNGFLSYNPHFFTQRTLLARFQMNNTNPPHVQFIRKPIYSVMGLLGLMGQTQVYAIVYNSNRRPVLADDSIGVLASVHEPATVENQDSWQLTALVYYSRDTHNDTGSTTLTFHLKNVLHKDVMVVIYQLDNNYTNPAKAWKSNRQPKTPSWKVLQEMRQHEGIRRVAGPQLYNYTAEPLSVPLSLPGVILLHMCAKPKIAPAQVSSVTVYNITTGEALIVWSDSCVHSKCIKTYEVEFSTKSEQGPYKRINEEDTIFTVFVHAPDPIHKQSVKGWYRVRAVDYWGQTGDYSLPVKY